MRILPSLACTMKLISVLCFALLVSFSLGRAVEELQDEWTLWKAENGKFYCENDEELERFAIWKSNKVYIEELGSQRLYEDD